MVECACANLIFSPLDQAVASRAVLVIVSGLDGPLKGTDRAQYVRSSSDGEDLGRRTSRFQITEEHHGTDIQLEAIGGKALGTPGGALS